MIAALLLAAGSGRRFGAPKLLEDVNGKPLIRWSAERLLALRLADLMVVVPPDHADIATALSGLELRLVVNEGADQGMGTSLARGIAELPRAVRAAIVALADSPPDVAVLQRVLNRYDDGGASIVAPSFDGVFAPPVLFDRGVFDELRALAGDHGAREVIERSPERVARIDLSGPPPVDVDTPADLARLRTDSRFGGAAELFSSGASSYAAARPAYPDELYRFIVPLAPHRSCAWDCGTGNGQAARDLARYFARVVATDPSPQQLAQAPEAGNVEYRVAPAEASGLAAASVDLVTVAQALHWFDLDPFYREVRRVTVRGGILAAWSYGTCHAGTDVEPLLREFEFGTLAPFWNPRRKWVDDGYRTVPFPFEEIPAPTLELRARWTLRQFGQYLGTWSAVATYRRDRGDDPVAPLLERVAYHWSEGDPPRDITWPLSFRVGRIS